MKSILVLAVLIAVVVAAPDWRLRDPAVDQFNNFVEIYNKVYAPEEVPVRFANFKASVIRAARLQAASPSAIFGITKFSDMTPDEFANTILMKNIIPQDSRPTIPATTLISEGAPATFDWRDKDAVTAVKDQEQCGSCWAFSATEAIESAWILKGHATKDTVNLSPQQIVDCDTIDGVQGCNGGETESAYQYIQSVNGQEPLSDYPYTGKNGKCAFEAKYVDADISGYTPFPKDETALSGSLSSTGPLSICLDAAKWQDYQSGVLTKDECCFLGICKLDHCVQLVGYNSTASTPYWIVRNSWNTNWGIEGYIWLSMGSNTCGLTDDITWPTSD